MKVLFLSGTHPGDDFAAVERLAHVASELQIITVGNPADALAQLRKVKGFHALMTSPTVPQTDALALIVSLRRDSVPIAIVPIVTETQQGFLASAVASGADDVLVMRGETFVNVSETLARIRQSPHLHPASERRMLRALYAGKDPVVWSLLDQVPFVKAERATISPDGVCPVRSPGATDGSLRCDAVVIDEEPPGAHPLQVLKSVKAQASDLPVVMLTGPAAGDVETAALDLGADDIVVKSGVFRRRLVATLRNVHQRLELVEHHTTLRAREARLRQIVENLPAGLAIVSSDGNVLAINAAALALIGGKKPTDLVGQTFASLVVEEQRENVAQVLRQTTEGERTTAVFDVDGLDGDRHAIEFHGVLLERDARGRRGVIALLQAPATAGDSGQAAATRVAAAQAELDAVKRRLRDTEAQFSKLAAVLTSERQATKKVRHELGVRQTELAAASAARAEIETALQALRTELHQAAEAHAWERTSWENTRHDLLAKLNDAQASASAGHELKATLDSVRADLGRATETYEWERGAWNSDRRRLQDRIDELEAAIAAGVETQAALESVRAELGRAAEAHAGDRARWETATRNLTSRMQELEETAAAGGQTGAMLHSVRSELGQVTEAHSEERARWDATSRELTARIRELEAAVAAGVETQAALESVRAEFGRTAEAHADDRARWETVRHELASRIHELDAVANQRLQIEATLGSVQAELRQATETHSEERARWEGTSRDLTGRIQELEASVGAGHRTALELESIRGELLRATDAHADDRAGWEAASRELSGRIQQLQAAVAAGQQTEPTLESVRAELRHATETHTGERGHWEATRQELADRIQALEADADHHRQIEATLESVRTEMRQATAAHSDERARWEATRHQMAERVVELEAIAANQAQIEVTLESVRAELRRATETHTWERSRWESDRRDLADRVRELQAMADGRPEIEAALETTRADLREATNTLAWERASWETARRHHEHQIRAQEEAREVDSNEFDRERQRLAAIISDLQHQLDVERATRGEVEQALREAVRGAEASMHELTTEHAATLRSLDEQFGQTTERLQGEVATLEAERAKLDADLAQANAIHHRLIECGLVGFSVTTLDGQLVRCNDAFARMFGYLDADDAIVRTNGAPFPSTAGRTELDARLIARRQLPYIDSCLERIDGRPLRVIECASILPDPEGGPALVERIFIEMNVRSELEERLQQARRLEEVGKLAAAITPDIESLVSSIDEPGVRLSHEVSGSEIGRRETDLILARVKRATDLVRQLLKFSRKQSRPPAPVDLNEVVQRAQPLLGRLVGSHIDFQVELGPTDAVLASEDDLDQLVTTLVVTVRDLLPVGGSLRLETATGRLDWATDGGMDVKSGPTITLAVTAAGYGVQSPQLTAPLELLAQRCGGSLDVFHREGRVGLQVHIPYFGRAGRRAPASGDAKSANSS